MSLKLVLLFLACCMALATSMPSGGNGPIIIICHARSPQPSGGVDFGYHQGQHGREANVEHNQNLYTSGDGRGSLDACVQANRNFDQNRNSFGGGVRGRWRK